MRLVTYGSAFTGCGAFDLGFQNAGFKCRWMIENDPNCQQLLKSRFPDTTLYGDIRQVDEKSLESVDLIIGGFPCVDISTMGGKSKDGLQGKGSGLFYDLTRIINQLKPKAIVMENVPQAIRFLDSIREALPDYEIESDVLNAKDFGDYTRRKRALLVGYLRGGSRREILNLSGSAGHIPKSSWGEDVLPMCLPWKGGLSLERLGSCTLKRQYQETNSR